MTRDEFTTLLEPLVNGDISAEDHARLEQLLKSNAEARAAFCERMDLESSLRTWAAEDRDSATGGHRLIETLAETSSPGEHPRQLTNRITLTIVISGIALLLAIPQLLPLLSVPKQLAENATSAEQSNDSALPARPDVALRMVGTIRQREDCKWGAGVRLAGGRFPTGEMTLRSGVALLSFDSGTDIALEAPCQLVVTSPDTARLESGNVYVTVTELSNGFTVCTPEAEIIDLGTEYAVSLNDMATEVHVFGGSVIWKPVGYGTDVEDRIETGEARLYSRSDPATSKRIPFGQRQFVRSLEAAVKAQAGVSLLAYDGFEYLAGQLRRGRSGFGWNGGWQSGRRGRGQLAEVVATPSDFVFGMDRTGRRQLELSHGDSIQRTLEPPLSMKQANTYFISVLIERGNSKATVERLLRISLAPGITGRHRRRNTGISFGMTTAGFPFINSGHRIEQTTAGIEDDETWLCVAKLQILPTGSCLKLRLYRDGDSVSDTEPDVWTITTELAPVPFSSLDLLEVDVGQNATWRIDELRIGTEWSSVVGQGFLNDPR
jgi:ferric-dicitrate binding protein FerR (iron transport regulator)